MLPTKNYKHTFNFVNIINRNTVNFFHLENNKNSIFDYVNYVSQPYVVTWQYKEKISQQFNKVNIQDD